MVPLRCDNRDVSQSIRSRRSPHSSCAAHCNSLAREHACSAIYLKTLATNPHSGHVFRKHACWRFYCLQECGGWIQSAIFSRRYFLKNARKVNERDFSDKSKSKIICVHHWIPLASVWSSPYAAMKSIYGSARTFVVASAGATSIDLSESAFIWIGACAIDSFRFLFVDDVC